MPVTGLRRRFFVTILVVLIFVTISSIYLYSVFIRKERLALIDQQVRETAAALVDSQLGDLRKIDFEEAEDIISEELGESRIGKFFIIRNAQGEVIFESTSAKVLPVTDVPPDQQWFEISTRGVFIRGLNLKLPRFPDRTLQVGLVLEEQIVNPGYLSKNTTTFVFGILILGLVISMLLTSYLLKPISMLDRFLSSQARLNSSLLPAVPEEIMRNSDPNSKDEFERVIASLNDLIAKVNRNYQFSRLWAYQMAHELKTPLSLLIMGLERLQVRNQISDEELFDIRLETQKISDTINSFLGWAELENSPNKKELFANKLSQVIHNLTDRMPDHFNHVRLDLRTDLIVPAYPEHLEQLIQNLMQNALKHSGEKAKITIELNGRNLCLIDNGPGIPSEVLARLGEPFNRGNRKATDGRGHGLGLAWANSICRRYGWDLSFKTTASGTTAVVKFNEDTMIS